MIETFTTHPLLYKQPSSRSVKASKEKMKKIHSKYVIAPEDKAANNIIIIWKWYFEDLWRGDWILRVYTMYAPAQLTNDKRLLHHIDTLT